MAGNKESLNTDRRRISMATAILRREIIYLSSAGRETRIEFSRIADIIMSDMASDRNEKCACFVLKNGQKRHSSESKEALEAAYEKAMMRIFD